MSSGCATRAIAQMKPTISRAIAVVTTTFGLPVAARRRYCAFQAMSLIAADSGSRRSWSYRQLLVTVGVRRQRLELAI